jgi:uncharacterized protein (TIGR04255 family)
VPLNYKRRIFHKDQLRLVLVQVRFPLLFRFNEKPFLAAFQEAIQADYPRVAQENQVVVKFSSRGVEPGGEQLWRFSDRDGAWSVVLGEGALTLECRKFTKIEDLEQRFKKLLVAAANHLGVEDRSRLGLRFVNEFRAKNAGTLKDWAKLLNPLLIGFSGTPEVVDGTIEQSFNEIRSKRDDGTFVIRHGLLTGSTVEPRPNEPPIERSPFYLLDLDYFDEREQSLDVDQTIQAIKKHNDDIFQFFMWTLDGGQLFEQLSPGTEGAK